jgi:hypothetical protein
VEVIMAVKRFMIQAPGLLCLLLAEVLLELKSGRQSFSVQGLKMLEFFLFVISSLSGASTIKPFYYHT